MVMFFMMFFLMVENASVIVMISMAVMRFSMMISMAVMRFSMMISMAMMRSSMMISMVVMRFSMMISMAVMRFSMMTSMMVVRSSMMTAVIPYLLMTDDLTDFWVRLIISPFLQPQPDSPGPLVRQQYGLGHSKRQAVRQSSSGSRHLLLILVPGQPESLVIIFSSIP